MELLNRVLTAQVCAAFTGATLLLFSAPLWTAAVAFFAPALLLGAAYAALCLAEIWSAE